MIESVPGAHMNTMFPLNPGMFIRPLVVPLSAWTGHVPFGSWLIHAIRPKMLVELGTHKGTSYLSFCQTVQEATFDTRCYAVDTWEGDEHAGEYGKTVFDELNEYHQKHYAGFSQLLRMTFDEATTYFADGTVDLLHIDGLHTYEAVRHDFESWLPKLSDGAVVLFHDTNVKERGFGVWKFWREVSTRYPSFEFGHSHGLGVLVVGARSRPLLESLTVEAGSTQAEYINRLFEFQGARLKADFDVGNLLKSLRESHEQISDLFKVVADRDEQVRAGISEIASRDELVRGLSASVQGIADIVSERSDLIRADIQHINHGMNSSGESVVVQYGSLLGRMDGFGVTIAAAVADAAGSTDSRVEMLFDQLKIDTLAAQSKIDALAASLKFDEVHAAVELLRARIESASAELSASFATRLGEQSAEIRSLVDERHRQLAESDDRLLDIARNGFAQGASLGEELSRLASDVKGELELEQDAVRSISARLESISQRLDMLSTDSQINMREIMEVQSALRRRFMWSPWKRLKVFLSPGRSG